MFTICRRQCARTIKTLINNGSKKSYSNVCQSYPLLSAVNQSHNHQVLRFKSKKSQKPPPRVVAASDADTEEEHTFEDDIADKNTKLMNISVNSLRVDGILKSGLGIARNKVETFFYESKIRVNGKKLLKKSDTAQEGDEIDIVKGPSATNPDFLNVARVEVLAIYEKGDNLSVKIRRCKNLTIEKYEDYAVSSSS